MTETRDVSIDEVRALVAERQRYDDWLSALDAKRADTPVRVFDRVHGDYVARREDVQSRLSEHVDSLESMGDALDARLATLESQLSTLEDERAEAMLRTAVGEYDAERWERVRQDVETQIGDLGGQRTALLSEVDEVRTLLSSARTEPPVEAPVEALVDKIAESEAIIEETRVPKVVNSAMDSVVVPDVESFEALDIEPTAASADMLFGGLGITHQPQDTFEDLLVDHPGIDAPRTSSADEMADLDNALALFSNDATAEVFVAPTIPSGPTGLPNSLDGVDVFDDEELGDLRMVPPASTTATVTPTNRGSSTATSPHAPNDARDGFDDLAFLRSVVEPSAQAGAVRAPSSGDQQKTLRCTECSTMNFPTEWYCERCGGELAAF